MLVLVALTFLPLFSCSYAVMWQLELSEQPAMTVTDADIVGWVLLQGNLDSYKHAEGAGLWNMLHKGKTASFTTTAHHHQ